jgi:hypothetical protein
MCSIAVIAAFSTLALLATASADTIPSYAARNGDTIHGRVSSSAGKYELFVRDDRGYVDHVVLHNGTIINPTGFELASGDTVTIFGRVDGHVFLADEIDTPYSVGEQSIGYDNSQTAYDYGVGYPGDYGYGYPYGYLGFGADIYFGGGYGRGGYYGHGYYGRGYYGEGRGSYGHGSYHGSYGHSGGYGRGASSGGSRSGAGGQGGSGSGHH